MEIGEKIAFKNELMRKTIHLSSIYMPILVFILDKKITVPLTAIGAVLMIAVDLLKHYTVFMNKLYFFLLGRVLRKDEQDTRKKMFTGGTYMLIGVFLTTLLFESHVASIGIFLLIISDSSAALVGKSIGKTRLLNKTVEGSAAFFISGFLIIFIISKYFAPEINVSTGTVALMLTAIIELIPSPVDDNISIPVFFGISYTFLNYLQ